MDSGEKNFYESEIDRLESQLDEKDSVIEEQRNWIAILESRVQ